MFGAVCAHIILCLSFGSADRERWERAGGIKDDHRSTPSCGLCVFADDAKAANGSERTSGGIIGFICIIISVFTFLQNYCKYVGIKVVFVENDPELGACIFLENLTG